MNHCICLHQMNDTLHHSDACLNYNHRPDAIRLTPDEQRRLNYSEGVGDVVVTRLDGTKSNPFLGIRYDANRMEQGFLTMEDEDDNIFHVANCDFWVVL